MIKLEIIEHAVDEQRNEDGERRKNVADHNSLIALLAPQGGYHALPATGTFWPKGK